MRAFVAAVTLLGVAACSQQEGAPAQGRDDDVPGTSALPVPPSDAPPSHGAERGARKGADPLGAVSLPDARSCHQRCLEGDTDATPEGCRSSCEEACKERCRGLGTASTGPCETDCVKELDAAMEAMK